MVVSGQLGSIRPLDFLSLLTQKWKHPTDRPLVSYPRNSIALFSRNRSIDRSFFPLVVGIEKKEGKGKGNQKTELV